MAASLVKNLVVAFPKIISSSHSLCYCRELNMTRDSSLKIISRMAGHSHWANIKFKKMHADLARSKLFGRISMEIITAVRESGPDPNFNPRLEKLIDRAKVASMPKSRVEGAIKSGSGSKDNPYTQCNFEVLGPGACGLIVDVLTANKVKAKIDISSILKKNGGLMKDGGSVLFQYQAKGIVTIDDIFHDKDGFEGATFPLNAAVSKAEELGIEAEAEDLFFTKSEDDKNVVKFICEVKALKIVSDNITSVHPDVSISTGIEFIPTTLVTLSDPQLEQADRLIELINNHTEVIKVYDNIANYPSATCKLFAES
ncbi:translational activator of cytochrome c oxidase 1 [Nematostella vectensis]|uniref:translational activator of cytochrome c oxidase 1 n=1 Tax=Nematostella vectensis TaxID=45351 RepID=UPI0013902F96|nr:translational activator of cytochrome c oxidase 1 [Nematostella vectensis]